MIARAVLVLLYVFLFLAGVYFVTTSAVAIGGLMWNGTPSAPTGFWRKRPKQITRGQWVVACVPAGASLAALQEGVLGPGSCPGGAELVIKRAVGLPGDYVEISNDFIAINSCRLAQSARVSLDWYHESLKAPLGQRWLGAGEYWLATN